MSARSVRTQGNSFRAVCEILGLGPGIRVSVPTRNASQCLDEAFRFLSRLLTRFAGRSIAGGGLTSFFLRGWESARFGKCQSIIFHFTILLFPFHSPTPLRCHLALQRLSHCSRRPSTVGAAIRMSCEQLCGRDTRQALGLPMQAEAVNSEQTSR